MFILISKHLETCEFITNKIKLKMNKWKYLSARKVLSNNVIGDSQVRQKSFKKWDLQLKSGK